jgi:hypothetical protein
MVKPKRTKAKSSSLSPELDEIIRVTDETVKERMSNLPYKIYPRPNEKRPRGTYWCPYDNGWKKFSKSKKNKLLDYPRCEKCNISLEDFWVKTHNELWENSKKNKKQ